MYNVVAHRPNNLRIEEQLLHGNKIHLITRVENVSF